LKACGKLRHLAAQIETDQSACGFAPSVLPSSEEAGGVVRGGVTDLAGFAVADDIVPA
jgi:hypothetical protein